MTSFDIVRILKRKSRFVDLIRSFFKREGFWEVETACLRNYPNLDPNVFPVKTDEGFLHTSPEYGMKKLLGLGADNIFQICKVFRKEREDELHRIEFTMLEWYKKNKNYEWLIEFSYNFLLFLCEQLKVNKVSYRGRNVDLTDGYEVFSLSELFYHFFGKSFTEFEGSDFLKFATFLGYDVSGYSWEETFHLLYVDRIEPFLSSRSKPVYLVDFPLALSAMAKEKKGTGLSERVELIIAGVEIMNGYSELTDSFEQRRRLERLAGNDVYLLDEEFIKLLDNIGSAAGAAIGIDRLFMLYERKQSLEEVCFKL